MFEYIPVAEAEISKEKTAEIKKKLDAGIPLTPAELYSYSSILNGTTTGIAEPSVGFDPVVIREFQRAYEAALNASKEDRDLDRVRETARDFCETRADELYHYSQNPQPTSLSNDNFEKLEKHIESLQGVVDLID